MAISGSGQEFDLTLKAAASLRTTTSQYKVVGGGDTTTAVDSTAYLANGGAALSDTYTARYAIGVNQTYMSSSSEECTVRMFGLTKAKCAASVNSWAYVTAYEGASTTTFSGHIQGVVNGASTAAGTTSITSHRTILGRALESGSTGTTISILLNPQMSDAMITGAL